MKLASADLIVWAIIAIVVAVAKGLGKLATPTDDESEESPPPPPRPRPSATLPPRRAVDRRVPQSAPPVSGDSWQLPPSDMREFMKRLTRPEQPPIVAKPAPPVPAKQAPVKKQPAPAPSSPSPAAAPAAVSSTRSSQWALALRDRTNVRNIIISAEIIGPPKGV